VNAQAKLADAAAMRGNRRGTPVARAVRDPQDQASPLVLKLGGRALETEQALDELAADLAVLDRDVVVVHGGGAEVTAWSERAGIAARFHDGRRVTDPATLEIAVAVLAGLANKRLVAGLRRRGVDAIGLAALDGGIASVVAHKDAAALGAVGTVSAIDPDLIVRLTGAGFVPVIASIGHADGALLNLNADDFAAAIAPALGAGALVLLSDTAGLVIDGAVVPVLDGALVGATLASPQVVGGMLPKLAAAQSATNAGVPVAWIAAWDGPATLTRIVQGTGRGTRIEASDAKEVARE